MRKVLHVISGLGPGGAEASLFRLVTGDTRNEHVVVSLMDQGTYGQLLQARGVRVVAIGMKKGGLNLTALFKLLTVVRSTRPAVIQTWMYHADLIGGLAGWLTRVPVVWGLHNTVLEKGKSSSTTMLIARICARLSGIFPAVIVACAKRSAEEHVLRGYRQGKFRIVPNGYDTSVFHPDVAAGASLRQQLGIDSTSWLVGLIARFDPFKDHENFLRAAALVKRRIPQAIFLLAGPSIEDSNDALKALLVKHGMSDNVLLLGRRTDMPAVFNLLSLNVLSSSAEAFPNVLPEAMACGVPCVSTDVGDAREILADTGWVVPCKDHVVLASRICDAYEAFQDAQAWRVRQQACCQRIARYYSMEKMIEGYDRAWTIANNPVPIAT